jgi:DNA-binding CsgD family transcriptional regulator
MVRQTVFAPNGEPFAMSTYNTQRKARGPFVVAVVLGTALAALGTSERVAASEVSPQAMGGISRYCSACWRNARLPLDRWNDCTQEVLMRLLQRVPTAGWDRLLSNETEERREFLRTIDTVKKRHQRERARSTGLSEPVADHRDRHDRSQRDEREALQLAADRVLSARQQRIVQMICEGHAVGDIALELSISPERVSDEKYKAIQKLRAYFHEDVEPAA